jgi:hypothetical protein
MVDKRVSLILCILVCAAVSLSACGKKEGDEPTKYRSQAGLEKLTQQAQQSAGKAAKPGGLVNPAFYAAGDSGGKAPEVKDLDSAIRPVLKKLFGGAKMVSESRAPETQRDGEVVENRFVYVVSRILTPKDGEALHAALCAEHFGTSPRLGSKPTIWSGGAAMSLFKTSSMRSYSLVVNIDTRKQQIVVESYRLGSKYDRLM